MPDWQPTDKKEEYVFNWKMCSVDSDCAKDHICVRHMWTYNGQIESGTGCWEEAVCRHDTAWTFYDDRKIQFFCSEEQKIDGFEYPYGWMRSEKHFDQFRDTCMFDSDCPYPDKQVCTYFLWDVTKDGKSYANGSSCYNWDVCPGPDAAIINENYTGYSYYVEWTCADSMFDHLEGSAMTVATSSVVIALTTLFTVM